jgi:hypothetical protein
MIIEFNTAYGKVSEKLVTDITNEILDLLHINKKISRAEVLLIEDETLIPAENKVCEIKLTIYGDDLLVHARTKNFESSATEAINELKKMVKKQVKQKNLQMV